MARANRMPNSWPSAVRRFITPSTRQYAGSGAVGPLHGIFSDVPSGMAAAFVTSTFGCLRFVRPEHALDCCPYAQHAERITRMMFLRNWDRTLPRFHPLTGLQALNS